MSLPRSPARPSVSGRRPARREPQGARHGWRRLHRLEPRARAARAWRHRSVLNNLATGNRANIAGLEGTSRSSRASCAARARPRRRARGRARLSPGRAPSVPRSVQDPLTTSAVTIEGTLNVLLARATRTCAGSSTPPRRRLRQLGDAASHRVAPDPISPYAVAELAAERYSSASIGSTGSRRSRFATSTSSAAPGPEVTVRRRGAALPRDDRRGRVGADHGDGTQSRDFTYVANVVAANLLAAEAEGADEPAERRHRPPGERGRPRRRDRRILGKPVEKNYQPVRTGDVRDSWVVRLGGVASARLRAQPRSASRTASGSRPTHISGRSALR